MSSSSTPRLVLASARTPLLALSPPWPPASPSSAAAAAAPAAAPTRTHARTHVRAIAQHFLPSPQAAAGRASPAEQRYASKPGKPRLAPGRSAGRQTWVLAMLAIRSAAACCLARACSFSRYLRDSTASWGLQSSRSMFCRPIPHESTPLTSGRGCVTTRPPTTEGEPTCSACSSDGRRTVSYPSHPRQLIYFWGESSA
jgi:hypothetical protein